MDATNNMMRPHVIMMKVHVNGVDINYEVAGEGSAVILLHGNGEDHHIFDVLVEELSRTNEVYAIDTRGHGGSSKAEVFHYEDMMEDIKQFIDELKIKKPVVYGFSDGGIIGLMLASKYPDLLSGLIASGPNLTPKDVRFSFRIYMRFQYIRNKDPLIELMLKEPNITDNDLKRITIPTLITIGSRDMVPLSHGEHIADRIENGYLMILDGEDHSSYIVGSDRLYPIISEFMSELEGRM